MIVILISLIYTVVNLVNSLSIVNDPLYTLDEKRLKLYIDPPNGAFSPTALAVFARGSDPSSIVHYELDIAGVCNDPTHSSPFITYDSPYIELDTLFKGSRTRIFKVLATLNNAYGIFRSEQYEYTYYVEAAARPYSYGFLIPSIESSGYFVRFRIEVPATARAQTAGGQEFADFFTNLGVGTYASNPKALYPQIKALNLLSIDSDLQGFEGGFAANVTDRKGIHYGILIPYHNGKNFFGKVVRVNLKEMDDINDCSSRYIKEYMNITTGQIERTGTVLNSNEACVHIIDLTTLHHNARGYRRGFFGYPYGYLSPGEFNIAARLDLRDFSLNTTRLIDLGRLDRTYGGYSGGFVDGTWACFSPFQTYSGPVGGLRSELVVDSYHLRPYLYSVMICIDEPGWNGEAAVNTTYLLESIRIMDFSTVDDQLRGFSDAIRLGRFAYFAPYSYSQNKYSSKLIRISLGTIDIGTTLSYLQETNQNLRSIIEILDLSKKYDLLRGFSSIFSSGQFLFLVPYRNKYEPQNGQRGNGIVVRINLNNFELNGVEYLDFTKTTRTQIPSFNDISLTGFSYGFASGNYGFLVPFFNANFFGKIARFHSLSIPFYDNSGTSASDSVIDLQELDLEEDRDFPQTYKGYRGGFCSLWEGTDS